ncbi:MULTISPECIES: DUF5133 domain-containing protein [unclassified Streptomyces]|uniref:DUF5133 domain-containing protein n=1 Tax=unclassified Streptomyces TaxID=2593676 RepID=UPI00331E3C08
MLMPHPATLRRLLTEYETLLAADTRADGTAPGARLEDLVYTLCVSTGTREIAHALRAAHDYLDQPIDSSDGAGAGAATGTDRVRAVLPAGRLQSPAGATPLPHSGIPHTGAPVPVPAEQPLGAA